jgi:hypothetical protein
MRLHHPLWSHLPAIGLLGYGVAAVAGAWPLADRVAVHFGLAGRPDRWGSPWEVLCVTFSLMAGLIVLSAFLDEKWARQETRKTFNWLSLVDEAFTGLIVAMIASWLDYVRQDLPEWNIPWITVAVFCGSAMAVAVVLELFRPCRPEDRPAPTEDNSELQSLVAMQLREGQSWVYWESQNPLYVSLLSLALCLIGVAETLIMVCFGGPWYIVIMTALLAAVGLILYGGLCVEFSRGTLTVRLGLLGIRLLRAPLSDIETVEVQAFRPLQEFGGWGLRYGRPQWSRQGDRRRGVWAFYFRGSRGVKVVRRDGRVYLVGSDHPERLMAVIRAAADARGAADRG